MAGITDQVFRRLCFEFGCGQATTEMVSAQGYLTAPPDRNAYRFLLARYPDEGPLAVQIFGSDPGFMAQAAARLSDLGCFSAIDINMGCPAQKVVGGQAGSALMKDPALAEKIVRQTVRATFLPVTVKMRLGWDDSSRCAVPFARMLEQAGAAALTVHGRTRAQQYAGRADWEAIAQVTRQADAQGQHKLLVTRSNADQLFPLDIWGLALESMLYSAQQGPEHTVTIYKEEDDFDRSDTHLYDNPDCYVAVNWWKQWWVSELNPRYFTLPAQGYKELLPDTAGYRFAEL